MDQYKWSEIRCQKKFAMDPWKFTQYLQYTEIFVFTTSWTLSNIFIAYLLAIGGHWRLLIANIVQILMVRCNLLYLKTSGVCITDVRKFLRGQKTIISVYCVNIVRIFMGPLNRHCNHLGKSFYWFKEHQQF